MLAQIENMSTTVIFPAQRRRNNVKKTNIIYVVTSAYPTVVHAHYALPSPKRRTKRLYLKIKKFIHLIFAFCDFVLFFLFKY